MNTPLEQKAWAAVQQYSLFRQGDRIAIGVSGGADSVALLRFLAARREENQWDLVVCHIHHGLRGEEADRDERFVGALAEHLGLSYAVRHIDAARLALEDHISVEEAGRNARYAFLAETAGEGGYIATAHTLDDTIETVLMNLIRGTGLHGLCGIPRTRGNIIRPLLDVTRAEVEEYLARLGQPYCTDSTNLTDNYTRNRIRHEILPQLRTLNPNFSGAMARMLPQLTAQWEMTETLANEAAQQLQGACGALSRQGLLALPQPICDRLLLRLLEQNHLPVSATALERMRKILQTGGKLDVAKRAWYFVAEGDSAALIYQPPEGILPLPVSWPVGEESLIFPFGAQKKVKLTLCNKIVAKQFEKFNISLLKNSVDCDKIIGNSVLRTRRPGDCIHTGKTGQKPRPLGEAWAAAGIPAWLRPTLLVLADEAGLLWAEGLGSTHRAAVTEKTGQYVIIECQEDKTP